MPPTVKKISMSLETMDIETAKAILGYEEVEKGGQSIEGPNGVNVQFVLKNNKNNRPFKIGLSKQYADEMFHGRWAGQWNHPSKTCNGETCVIDSKGNVVSCAHRLVGLVIAEYRRQRYEKMDRKDVLKAAGIKGPITFETILVHNVDPKCADTADTGKKRDLGDVLFREDVFKAEKDDNGKKLADSVKTKLSRELAVALRLIWLRLRGEAVAGGSKLLHTEALEFLKHHPQITGCLMYCYVEEGGNSKVDGKKISAYLSLGYAAALMYLATHSDSNRDDYENGSLDMTVVPELGGLAEEFWTVFAQEAYGKKRDETVKALHKILERNAAEKVKGKLSRDALCVLVARAWSVYINRSEGKWKTPRALGGSLIVNGSLDLVRFGGLDLDKDVLEQEGYVEEVVITRQKSDKWKLKDTCWVHDYVNLINWFGTIVNFTDDGTAAMVHDAEDDQTVPVDLSMLQADRPEEFEEEEETEESEASEE